VALSWALAFAPPATADHCGATATVVPPTGPIGTTFVFKTDLGAASVLRLFQNGEPVEEVSFPGNGFIEYQIDTHPGDAGSWRARAEVLGSPQCIAEAHFTVAGLPQHRPILA
jgi:hypothetical protein